MKTKISLNQFLIIVLCAAFMIALSIVAFLGPALDALDNWAAQTENQVKVLFCLAFLAGVVGVLIRRK